VSIHSHNIKNKIPANTVSGSQNPQTAVERGNRPGLELQRLRTADKKSPWGEQNIVIDTRLALR